MAFHVVDYKGVKVGEQGKIVFTHRTMKGVVEWLYKNQTAADLDNDRYALDGDPESWRRWERRQMQKA